MSDLSDAELTRLQHQAAEQVKSVTAGASAAIGGDKPVRFTNGDHWGYLAGIKHAVLLAISAINLIAKADRRVTALEAKLAEAERKGFGIRYQGVFREGKSYIGGEFVTHQGGLWHCNEHTETRPGSGPHWTLAVKSGDSR